jgi:hypothetical protein
MNRLFKNLLFLIILSVIGILIIIIVATTIIANCRMQQAICQDSLGIISTIGEAITKYAKERNQMPNAAHWADDILASNPSLTHHDFRISQLPKVDCAIAYNQYLSDANANNVPKNTVVLFEADGEIDLTGDKELLLKPRAKDLWFNSLLNERKFVFIYFYDGTIAKYRLHDEAISIYMPEDKNLKYVRYEDKNFTKYTKNSIYLPLNWFPE